MPNKSESWSNVGDNVFLNILDKHGGFDPKHFQYVFCIFAPKISEFLELVSVAFFIHNRIPNGLNFPNSVPETSNILLLYVITP